MLLYRVFPFLPAASTPADPGHPEYVHHPQSGGRLDNPGRFAVRYLALEPSGAVGEVFGDLAYWSPAMFDFPALSGASRALGTYAVPDDSPLLDLDDSYNLYTRGLRPTQVIERNRSSTSAWARRIWDERGPTGGQAWAGVRWWSYHLPGWRVVGAWDATPVVVNVEALHLGHPAVTDAASALHKEIRP